MTDLTVSQTILAQLGGGSFVTTSGATGLVASADGLTFKLGRNPKRVTHVRVTVTHDGLYDITFFTIGKGPQSYDGIHPEMLQERPAYPPSAKMRSMNGDSRRARRSKCKAPSRS